MQIKVTERKNKVSIRVNRNTRLWYVSPEILSRKGPHSHEFKTREDAVNYAMEHHSDCEIMADPPLPPEPDLPASILQHISDLQAQIEQAMRAAYWAGFTVGKNKL